MLGTTSVVVLTLHSSYGTSAICSPTLDRFSLVVLFKCLNLSFKLVFRLKYYDIKSQNRKEPQVPLLKLILNGTYICGKWIKFGFENNTKSLWNNADNIRKQISLKFAHLQCWYVILVTSVVCSWSKCPENYNSTETP